MGESGIPSKYLNYNSQQTKHPILVVVIDGAPDVLTNVPLKTRVLYGDPGVVYGAGYVYGGLKPYAKYLPGGGVQDALPYIDLNNSQPTIQQQIEPESGRASVSMLTLAFIDFMEYITQLCTPGVILPELIGREVKVYLGYEEISYPQDFFQIFRGYISTIDSGPGLISLQLSDPNIKRRQTLFYIGTTVLTVDVGIADGIITVQGNANFFQQIRAPGDGVIPPWNESVHTYIQIDSEWIECDPILPNGSGFSLFVQGITYTAQPAASAGISITYVSGGTAGSEIVTVTGLSIVVQIEATVSTATQVAAAIAQSAAAMSLITTSIYPPNIGLAQTVQAQTYLAVTTYAAACFNGLLFMAAPGHSTDVFICFADTVVHGSETIVVTTNTFFELSLQGINYYGGSTAISVAYTSGGVAGSEIVSVSGNAISVQIEVGVSTAYQVAAAINGSAAVTALGVTVILEPVDEGELQVAASATNLTSQTGNLITINIQAGVSTNDDILKINTITPFPYVSYQPTSNSLGNVQTARAATPLANAIPGTQFAVTQRGARSTTYQSQSTPAVHSAGTTVNAGIQIGDATFPENAMQMALKLMLSGWDGPWITGEPVFSVGQNPDPDPSASQTSVIQLPAGVDAVEDYNLTAGDVIILQGSDENDNGIEFIIIRFADNGTNTNNLIFVSDILNKEINADMTIGFRSQYDVYPTGAGLKLTPLDVDVAQHLSIQNTFLALPGNDLIFFITSQEDSGKTFIESQIYLVVGAYSLTRRGLLSLGYHSPPIANQNIVVLTPDNIQKPDQIHVVRSANNRTFYNEIDLTYNYDDTQTAQSSVAIVDSNSIATTKNGGTGLDVALPIDARGVYSGYSSTLLEQRAFFLLNRYKRGAIQIKVTVNWEIGSITEAGDIALIQDPDNVLQISNFSTGARGIISQLFEVLGRTFNIKDGTSDLILVGGVGSSVSDRFATISPSSLIAPSGSTETELIIQDSFGALYPGNESKKWSNYVGQSIQVHSFDFSVSGTAILESIDVTNNYMLHISGLTFIPQPGYIVDIVPYSTSPDPTVDSLYKTMHVHISPTVAIVSGIDQYNFTVGSGDISKFQVGMSVRVHDLAFIQDSGTPTTDIVIKTIVGDQISVSAPLGFTPSSSMVVDMLGFPDFNATNVTGECYRLI